MNCPGFERLIDFLDDRLDDPEAARIAAHLLTNCDACDETCNWYLQVKSIAASDDLSAPPSWVFKRAVRIFETSRGPRRAARVGHAIASLVFDSFARQSLAGVRSTETANCSTAPVTTQWTCRSRSLNTVKPISWDRC